MQQPESIRHIGNWTFLPKLPDGFARLMMAIVIRLLPIVGPIMAHGWDTWVMHRRLRGDERLPPYDDLGRLLKLGIMPFLLQLIMGFVIAIVINVAVWIAILVGAGAVAGLGAAGLDPGIAAILLIVVQLVLFGFALVLSLLCTVPFHASMLIVEITGDLGAALKPSNIMAIMRGNVGALIGGGLIHGLLTTVLFFVGYLMFFIGMFPVIALSATAACEMRLQIYRRYLAQGGQPLTNTSFIDGGPLEVGMGPWDPAPAGYPQGPPPQGPYAYEPGPPQDNRF